MTTTEETMNMSEAEQIARLDALLGEAKVKIAEEKAEKTVGLAALLGEYEALEGHPGFYGRAPKLRQQIEIARISEQNTGAETAAENLMGAAALARLAVYVAEDGGTRIATLDEVLDNFDSNEIVALLSKYLGLKVKEDAETGDPT